MMKTPVIVLDGNQRSALAAVRTLGSKGIPVIVGDEIPRSLAAVSRFCQHAFVYPSPYDNPEAFLDEIVKQSLSLPRAVLMPMTDVALSEVLRNRDKLPNNLIVPFPEWNVYQQVSDKVSLFRKASRLGIPIPQTLFSSDFNSHSELLSEGAKLGFPLVLKPGFSRVKQNGRWLNTRVQYARNKEELQKLLDDKLFRNTSFVVQEKIEGPGLGVFLFMDNGRIAASFAHQRMREKPPSGGVSVLCRSIEIPQSALESSRRLLEGYKWSGVAMAEYKLDIKTGIPKLMEINARFWGSLQLSISAGVDFPYVMYRHALGNRVDVPAPYRVGVMSRWELGDLDHLLIRMRRKDNSLNLPLRAPSKVQVTTDFFFDFFRSSVRNEVLRIDDPLPFITELHQYMLNLNIFR